MKKTLEILWDDYLCEQCSMIESDEERKLAEKALYTHEKLNNLLNREQWEAVEKYVDMLCNVQALFEKKAFIKGCEFTASFILETGTVFLTE